jgi:hypothetical protein
MDAVLLVAIVFASSALAVAGVRGTLGIVFHLMAHPQRLQIRWGRVIFAGALFWFWYFAPGFANVKALLAR